MSTRMFDQACIHFMLVVSERVVVEEEEIK